jgi:hypothetical protein
VDSHADETPDRFDHPPDPLLVEFRAAVAGTDVHAQVRAAAMRAAKTLGVEERLVARLPPPP